ncbi:MAG: translation elongation factor Ts [Candidatus Dormibacteraeota bacterium]|nr:translation elongation factor Ts [Candidatus Dormibacteraeota bacterium]
MAAISAAEVKRLRDDTGAGMMDAKRALTESGGDFERAKDWLRVKGLSKAADKVGRATNEGEVEAYVHNAGGIAKQGALVELQCESDFVAKTHDFKALAKELALQVVGASPAYVAREDVPSNIVERERAVYRESVQGKPDNIIEKILEGKLNDFYSKVCLLEQQYIRDDKKKVKDLVTEAVAKLGENITVARFARFAVGEEATTSGNGAGSPKAE